MLDSDRGTISENCGIEGWGVEVEVGGKEVFRMQVAFFPEKKEKKIFQCLLLK